MLILAKAINIFCEILVIMILAQAVMSWFVRPGDRVYSLYLSLRRLTEPMLQPFRRLMGRFGMSMGIDFSPIAAIIVISLIQRLAIALLL